ncbi:hypothetical protein AZE42_08302 [Rhizopogon vesiculosus]|uniref:Uncharacterized protein n=1 Tax=Rhizopogon vesiculosus TaxID=180088 RepID=A0A1J8QRI0_9AGAM|nr:hypothetical protein AZE42_08302 [Rhizopogon vesiculosus]
MKQCQTLVRVDDDARQSKVTILRSLIYDRGYGVRSNAVENLLKEHSLVPTSNTFLEKLRSLGFNLFIMLVIDLMHEFELGVWKALFTHLIRILNAAVADNVLLHELDCQLTPTFGCDTIRKFASNASEMKRMAAWDFEDLLQCAIPVFEALLPEPHNKDVLTLLFTCAQWHALAKLHMHTDETLDLLDNITVKFGKQLHHFQKHTCIAFKTQELRQEAERRQCRQSRGLVSNGEATTSTHQTARRSKTFNLQTYKLHALGDYLTSICNFDRKEFVKQIASIEWREAHIHCIRDKQWSPGAAIKEEVATSPKAHFHIGKSQNYPENIPLFLQRHLGDPVVRDFLPKLQRFLLPKIKGILMRENDLVTGVTPACSDLEGCVLIKADRMYRHCLMHLNYTTYDVRQAQDVINPSTPHCNIMLLANSDSSALVNIPISMLAYSASIILPVDHVYFPPMAEPEAFGFVDPDDILRCCHVIPRFTQGLQHLDGKGISHCAQDKMDRWCYYINCFVDHDMFVHYHWGLGVGHTYAHSHKDPDANATADMGDLEVLQEEEEEDPDQHCGISNSDGEASDSDSGTDSDVCDEVQYMNYDDDEYNILDYEN